ncbi:protein KNATM-like [Mangifera indica]|uniref:protein KNATM-like n=1 Tax=Mangifera indica TaxID=29780 RepID=UPI001CFA6E83|nr:protein KNATM-like [Mangifera indica]
MEAETSATTVENNAESSENNVHDLSFFEEKEEEEDDIILKKSISSHHLFGVLIQTHLSCFKVGLGELGEFGTTNAANAKPTSTDKPSLPTSSELDRFMEAYCITLGKLKEAMEAPLQEITCFIDAMYIQLKELCETHTINNPQPNPPTS